MDNEPIINLEETPGKVVGRLRSGAADYDRLVDAAMAIMPRLPFPKGVYRFRSHEEANEWMEKHILEGAVRRIRDHRGRPAATHAGHRFVDRDNA